MKINDALKDQLLGKIPGIETLGHSTFMQYDRITIDTRTGTASFSWKGKDMFSIVTDHYEPGVVLTLTGFEGRTAVSLSN